jgi:recombination protein RecA
MPADDKTSRASTASSGAAPGATTSASSKAAANPERDKALGLVLNQIERNFGKGSIMRLGDASRMRIETSPTGALTLDLALGGGYPKARRAQARPRSPCMPSPRCSAAAAWPPS